MAVSNTEAEKTQDKPGIYYSTKKQGSAKKITHIDVCISNLHRNQLK